MQSRRVIATTARTTRSATQHAQACRPEVKHLAGTLADDKKCTAAARADVVLDIEGHVLTCQMVGERLTSRRRFKIGIVDSRHRRRLRSGNVDIEVFEPSAS